MPRSPASRQYARALFELAREQGRLDAVQADLVEVARQGTQSDDFKALLSPFPLPVEHRKSAWRSLLQDRADPLTLRFVLFLLEKNRGGLLAEIIRDFESFYNEAKGIVAVEIVSARPLPPDQSAAIQQKLESRLGKKIKASLGVDPSLLGGFLVRVGDTVHDYSVNHQLEQLHRKFATA